MSIALKSMIAELVSGIEPADDLAREHGRDALWWLAATDDIDRFEPHLLRALGALGFG